MPNLSEIIQQMQRDLRCPVCGKQYEVGEIRLKGIFNHVLVVQTICDNNHITIFMTTFHKISSQNPISSNDIIDLHKTLEKFDGDFQKLWNR